MWLAITLAAASQSSAQWDVDIANPSLRRRVDDSLHGVWRRPRSVVRFLGGWTTLQLQRRFQITYLLLRLDASCRVSSSSLTLAVSGPASTESPLRFLCDDRITTLAADEVCPSCLSHHHHHHRHYPSNKSTSLFLHTRSMP